MLEVMDQITARIPRVVCALYVDDISMETTGGPRQVARTLAAASAILGQEVKKVGLDISTSKSVVLSTAAKTALAIDASCSFVCGRSRARRIWGSARLEAAAGASES